MEANIPETKLKRIVVIGGGFGGLKLVRGLVNSNYQVVLLDKNNYHQFQPLFYQVATAGLEPSTISFPFRKIFQGTENIHIRVTEVIFINTQANYVTTGIGKIKYDSLVLAVGADTNFYGNKKMQEYSLPMKSVAEALDIRNRILENYEMALTVTDKDEQQSLMNMVIVGGGPTGVEVSGTLAQMKKHILPKDYPELDFTNMQITLIETSPKLLGTMSSAASQKAELYLKRLGVEILTNTSVKEYDGKNITLSNGSILNSRNLVWAAGVTGNKLDGIPKEAFVRNNRIKVDRYNKIEGLENIFAIGDIAFMSEEKYPNGHPQVAQTAIQQAKRLASNFKNRYENKKLVPFQYKDLGSLATIGKNLAVADLPFVKFQGFFAWLVWTFVHLMAIVGVKNRIFIFINWLWNYVTYDQSLRLIIRSKNKST
ncbi:MAG TPA: NAD(P)/FAD-dependent oxidoreductase [Bacteroidia bacterium]|jgi:NADH dehydrogenase|nr:NAD(P)/FAD-dependent oxidoreductase [Bacteroidia bacterium]